MITLGGNERISCDQSYISIAAEMSKYTLQSQFNSGKSVLDHFEDVIQQTCDSKNAGQ